MAIINNRIRHIVINRVDAMGDVILTLPACFWLKKLHPGVIISFLARSYTEPVIKCCSAVDHFINYEEFNVLTKKDQAAFLREKNIDAIVHVFPNRKIAIAARLAGIKIRVGTTSKLYNYINCNRIVKLSRKNSDLHEAQQNIFILQPLGVSHVPTIGSIAGSYQSYFKPRYLLPANLAGALEKDKFNLIIHPKSNGHGREWAMSNFTALIKKLPAANFNILITGSEKEHEIFKEWIPLLPPHVINLSGKMTLDELISFVFKADGLLASGTGPLHLAAASGIHTLGLFPVTRSVNAARWAPLGKQAEHIESNGDDLSSIAVDEVYNRVTGWLNK